VNVHNSSSYFAMSANEFYEGYQLCGGYRFVWLPKRWRQLRNRPLRSFAHHDRLQIDGQNALT
jgi:hypothetical protein